MVRQDACPYGGGNAGRDVIVMETLDGQTVRARLARSRDWAGLIVSWGLRAALSAGLFSYVPALKSAKMGAFAELREDQVAAVRAGPIVR
jgi:hypothetical protein